MHPHSSAEALPKFRIQRGGMSPYRDHLRVRPVAMHPLKDNTTPANQYERIEKTLTETPPHLQRAEQQEASRTCIERRRSGRIQPMLWWYIVCLSQSSGPGFDMSSIAGCIAGCPYNTEPTSLVPKLTVEATVGMDDQ